MPVFTGVGVALVTIFADDLLVDIDATSVLAERLVAAGISAVVVGGSTGEAYALTGAERRSIIEVVRTVLPTEIPVIAGTGAPSARQAGQLTEQAVDAGADAVLVLSPPRSPDPRPYYDVVAQAADSTPVLAYHFPRASSPGISMDHLRDLPVEGVKDSTGDPDRLLQELTTYEGDTYVGSSAILTQAGALGTAGAILALANSQPEDCIRAFDGDPDAQLRLAPHHHALAPFPGGIKAQVADRWGFPPHRRMG
ncbi:dihydrodipicolinate synthase family protein [Euzebya tangerina]|uniref:dihydrodipicolinate synthase family protein n=1 Tax=Euzebya tangerina TaxID=591198 RepID=UPI000E324D13|nr:dihydrodipicolinate synthase family protein [Euzebya tangerina]